MGLIRGFLIVPILVLGCVSGVASETGEATGTIGDTRTARDRLVLGPDALDRTVYRVSWSATVGLLSTPVWLPWLFVDALISLVRDGEAVFVVQLHEGRIGFNIAGTRAPVETPPHALPIPPNIEFGRYHALLIGNNDYRHLKKLITAVNDAESVSSLLRDAYGFEATLLRNATRADIVSQLFEFRRNLGPEDNLLIYYAGHGHLDRDTEEGYWLPVDATEDDPTHWLANTTISTMLKAIPAKHILLVVDSCFSGSLNRSGLPRRIRRPGYLSGLVSKRARVVLTSGGLEPVGDLGGYGHSVFATHLLRALRENSGVLDGSSVFLAIRKSVMENAHQTPEYGPIRFTGHDGGDFLFVRLAGPLPE